MSNWTHRKIHQFSSSSDAPRGPIGTLASVGNRIFGTTYGGTRVGAVYSLTKNPSGGFSYDVLHQEAAGTNPNHGVIVAENGTIYGTTDKGGSAGKGTFFKIDSAGAFSVVFDFGTGQGKNPNSQLLLGRGGSIFGTTRGGSREGSTIYRVSPSGRTSILYRFDDGKAGGDGVFAPFGFFGRLAQGKDGAIYGTAQDERGNAIVWTLNPVPGKGQRDYSQIYAFRGRE